MRWIAVGVWLILVLTGSKAAHCSTPNAIKWTGRWVQAPWSTERDGAELDGSRPMPIFRKDFIVQERPTKVVLRIAGLGQYTATLNGIEVSSRGLHQAWTNYRKSVTYDTLDVTTLVRPGNNVLGVMLGNGMYNVQATKGRYTKFENSFGVPMLIAELQLKYPNESNKTIASDGTWEVKQGPITFSSTYGGEDFDARRIDAKWDQAKTRDAGWTMAKVVTGPAGKLIAAIAPDVLEKEMPLAPAVRTLSPNKVVYDFGQNLAGWPRIVVSGSTGSVLKLTPGELLQPDGSVSQQSSGGPQWWSYTLRGDRTEIWEPQFSYYGFRYLQLEWIKDGTNASTSKVLKVSAERLTSNSPVTGSFQSSNETLNAIHKLIVEAMHNNEVSVFTDCPHREKLGWLEQTHLIAPGLMYNNDLEGLYRATEKNMEDAQHKDGMVPTIAPQYTMFGPKYPIFDDSPEWGSASILAAWRAYQFYGDATELKRNYPLMKAYVQFLESKAVEGIVAYGLGDWYDIGKGEPGVSKLTTIGVTGTLMLYEDAMTMAKIAKLLAKEHDAVMYGRLAEREKAAFNKQFWNDRADYYDKGSQTANAMPLALGVVPIKRRVEVLAHVVADIRAHDDHITTGEIGYPYMLRALMENGHNDVIAAMMLRKDPPSYGSQLASGATSLTEAWDANPKNSQDHFMLGGAEEWFYRGLGGIDFDMSRENAIVIRPSVIDGVDWVRCGFVSRLGKIESNWKHDGAMITMTVDIPAGASALVYVPAKDDAGVQVGNRPSAKTRGAKFLRREPEAAIYRVGAGSYQFTTAR